MQLKQTDYKINQLQECRDDCVRWIGAALAYDMDSSRFFWERMRLAESEDAVVRGRLMIGGPKHKRSDFLGCAIKQALLVLGRSASAAAVLNYIGTAHGKKIDIGELYSGAGKIYWNNRQGHEKATTLKAFRNRLAAVRKKIQT